MVKNLRYIISLFLCLFWYSTCQAIEVSENATAPGPKLVTLPGKATAAAPAWTDGRTVPLSVDTSGNLRVTGAISSRQSTSSSAYANPATATITQLVALSSGLQIKVYGFFITSHNPQVLRFVYGTGVNCGTGTTTITGDLKFNATVDQYIPMVVGFSLFPIFTIPASNALCIQTDAAQLTGIHVSYIKE